MKVFLTIIMALLLVQLPVLGQEKVEEAPPEQKAEATPEIEINRQIENLVEQLGSDDWQTRENAMKKLIEIGEPVVAAVARVVDSEDMEVKVRAEKILDSFKWVSPQDTAEIDKVVAEYVREITKKIPDEVEKILEELKSEDAGTREKAVAKLVEVGSCVLPLVKKFKESQDEEVKALAVKLTEEINKKTRKLEREKIEHIKKIKFSDFYLLRKLTSQKDIESNVSAIAELLSGLLGLSYWNGPDNVYVRGNKIVIGEEEIDLPAGPWRLEEKGDKVFINGKPITLPVKVEKEITVADVLGKIVAGGQGSMDLKLEALEMIIEIKDIKVIPFLIKALKSKLNPEDKNGLKLQHGILQSLAKLAENGPACSGDGKDIDKLQEAASNWKKWWRKHRKSDR